MRAALPSYPLWRAAASALLLALLCQGCAKPARVVLYEQRHRTTAYSAPRSVPNFDAPVPPAKPRAAPRGAVEVSRLDPPGKTHGRAPAAPPRETQIAVSPLPATTTTTARSYEKTAEAPSHYRPMPADGVHVVKPKETVYALSRLYGVPVRSLLTLNKLDPPYLLHTGQKVRIPPQKTHVVVHGETVYAISRQFDVSLAELVRLNEIKKPYTIVTGQTLLLPDTQRTAVATAAPVAEGDTSTSGDTEVAPEPGGDRPANRPAQPETAPAPPVKKVVLPPSTNIPQPSKLSAHGFLWPVKGKVISRFGPKGKGLHNDGINIAAPKGTPILAAQHGVVAYSGNELRGFGNLILIKHDKGYMTAYAHASQILVKPGTRVKRGEVIGRVGSTGSVAGPQLHFEIRRGRRPIDPLQYLGQQRAAKDGAVDTAESGSHRKG